MKKCTLTDLEEMMKRAKIEATVRPCPEHDTHIIENGKMKS